MAMSTSEIDQVITLIDRSKDELQTRINALELAALEEQVASLEREGEIIENVGAVTNNIIKVMFIITALVQIEIVASAWWLVSH